MSIRNFVAVAGIAALATGCADVTEPFAMDVQHDIEVPGNTLGTSGCEAIDRINCFAILDNQIKVLYERNNWAARRGEAEYRVVTNSNNELASIFGAESRTVAEATRYLDRFIDQIATARSGGRMTECWGAHIQTFAEWIRGKVVAGNLDVSDAPQMDCFVSPVAGVSGSGTEADGVQLRLDDPWHFTGDPYNIHTTMTYFVIQGPNGTITTAPALQTGAAIVMVADPSTRTPGVYQYSVTQCADWGRCSAPVTVTVTVAAAVTGGGSTDPLCVHDNRDGLYTPLTGPAKEKCDKQKQ